jgi:aryl-alcohol dehydrogenase-like predicted oxidoreductase
VRYKLLGNSGLRVSELCLGTMTFGEDWGWGAPKGECEKIFRSFAEANGNFIDTSCNYTNGTSEKFVGELVADDRDRFVVATKYSLNMRSNDPNAGGNHRKNLIRSLDASLERLQTDYVDLLWLHMWDGMTPVEEVMRSLDDVVRAGKVRYVGVSDTPAWVVARANTMAEVRGWTPFVALQVPYNLANRDVERDLIPMARSSGLAVCAWAPLAQGLFTGKYTKGTDQHGGRLSQLDWGISERSKKIASQLDLMAKEFVRSTTHVALNWLRQQKGTIIPIVGATNASQMKVNLGCLDFRLTEEQMKQLNDMSRIELGFPRDFLENDEVRGFIFGETFPIIDAANGQSP